MKEASTLKHARAILEPVAVHTEWAKRSMKHIGPGRFISHRIDLWNGCFDVEAILPDLRLLYVQITTDNPGSISRRKRKIEEKFLGAFSSFDPAELSRRMRVELWAWVKRKGFLVFRWSWQEGTWVKGKRLLKAKKSTQAGTGGS